jgi:Molecular chaperone, HSP90 family
VKLYVRRVFITDDCADILPGYLRFLQGIVDSEDLPLSISREMLQHNPLLAKIRAGLVKRSLGELAKLAEKDAGSYADFWKDFGPVLKEGLYEDQEQRETLLKLARFRSTQGEELVSLADYVGRMKPGTGSDLLPLRRERGGRGPQPAAGRLRRPRRGSAAAGRSGGRVLDPQCRRL